MNVDGEKNPSNIFAMFQSPWWNTDQFASIYIELDYS